MEKAMLRQYIRPKNFNPDELLAICDATVEDGELTYVEIQDLADWVKNHPESHQHWPGDLLVAPLQNVWTDGNVTKAEARLVGQLILRIRKKWRRSSRIREKAIIHSTRISETFDHSRAQLPSMPIVLRIKSHTDDSVTYNVDMRGPSCTCLDFRSLRQKLPIGHLTRCCKHMFNAYAEIEPMGGWTGWLGAYLEYGWKPHPQQEWAVIEIDSKPILISSAPQEWANVFAPYDNNSYERFGFSVVERRWSYSIEPRGADRIASAVVALTNS